MKYAVLGFGGRGSRYAELFAQTDNAAPAAVCEIRRDRLDKSGKLYGLPADKLFLSDKDFFARGKLADLCVVATQDGQHKDHAAAALDLGYDLLLEKPIATDEEDCRFIYEKAKKLGRRVFVCHVLRYAPFFSLIKQELSGGLYGKVTNINMTENVAYWHQAHSYVRGNWRKSPPAAPMIIAKCCHDLDIIAWLADTECLAVSSMGTLGYFKRENAPAGSADRCLDCAVKKDCPYNAERIYVTDRFNKGYLNWPVDVLCEAPTKEKLAEALKTGPYGRCVYKCDNDVVDRQIVNMDFRGGIAAHLTMTAFSGDCYRKVHVHCEKGEIFGDMETNVLTCNFFGKPSKKIDVRSVETGGYGHGGGDYLLIKDVAAMYNGGQTAGLTSIEKSMRSHAIGFAAEKSRLLGGELVKLI